VELRGQNANITNQMKKEQQPQQGEQPQEWTRAYLQSLCSNLLSDHDSDSILSPLNAALAAERERANYADAKAAEVYQENARLRDALAAAPRQCNHCGARLR
jgi:hypothetical protein